MPDNNDNVFRKNVQSTRPEAGKLRQFTVGEDEQIEPTEYSNYTKEQPQGEKISVSDYEDRIGKARQDKVKGVIPEGAKKRIEILANIGRLTKDVMLDGIKFSLRTLKSKESKEASLAALNTEFTIEAGFMARKQQLARAIFRIDDQDLGMVLGSDLLEARLEFIDEMEEVIVGKLFDEFSALKEESIKKYSIVDEKQAKEVAEDLKK